ADGSLGELRRLAHLPIRVRVKVAGPHAAAPAWLRDAGQAVNGHHFDLTCTPDTKMALLRRAVESGSAVDDIEVAEPT
ncbi:hypothetical protein CH337_22840, partial [Rhodoblastus acidophilus]